METSEPGATREHRHIHQSNHHTTHRLPAIHPVAPPLSADPGLITTDLVTSAQDLVARYCARWSIEQTIKDGKDLLGVGDAQNRLPRAVQRTVPFMPLTLTILVCWYNRFGDAASDLTARRGLARWYRRKKTTISVTDMLIAFRRARITTVHTAQTTPDLNNHTAVTSTTKAA